MKCAIRRRRGRRKQLMQPISRQRLRAAWTLNRFMSSDPSAAGTILTVAMYESYQATITNHVWRLSVSLLVDCYYLPEPVVSWVTRGPPLGALVLWHVMCSYIKTSHHNCVRFQVWATFMIIKESSHFFRCHNQMSGHH